MSYISNRTLLQQRSYPPPPPPKIMARVIFSLYFRGGDDDSVLLYCEESHSVTNERAAACSLLNCIQARSHLCDWNLSPHPLCCIISFLSVGLHLGLWKGPIVCSIGPTVLIFPAHICQESLVSCHLDLSNYLPILGGGGVVSYIEGNTDGFPVWTDLILLEAL